MKHLKSFFKFLVGLSLVVSSCFLRKGGKPTAQNPGQLSTATGLKYTNDPAEGFAVMPYSSQPEAPNMVFIEGGTYCSWFVRGGCYVFFAITLKRTVSVASFYMDETEIANIHWLEYLYHLTTDSTKVDGGKAYTAALPDTLVLEV